MQLEAVTPSHRSLTIRSHALENFVGIASEVMAHRYHCRVHETDATTLAEALKFHEEHHVEEHARHELNETVVRDGIGKIAGEMSLYIKQVVMLEIGERAKVIAHKYGHYLAVAQPTLAVAVTVFRILKKKVFCTFRCKIITKLIHNTKNFCNFVLGNHRLYFCKLLNITCKGTKYLRDYQLL
jgi:hypothetical protein